jgi:7-keto-8-aminopelargonate synthetase-like enzyme
MVDEAHATGVLGTDGAGLVHALGLGARVPVQMGTLGKALGCAGAYVAGSRALIDLLVNRARSFVFTTGLAPATVAAAAAAIDVVVSEPERREALRHNAAVLRAGLEAQGFTLGGSTHILPLVLGDNRRTLAFAAALRRHGVLVHAIRPPTVPTGTARLRITPMATHTAAQLAHTLAAFTAASRETEHA